VDAAAMGNQISLKLNDQLAQMRALQTAQMSMVAMRQEAESAEAAREKAASDELFGFDTTPPISRPATSY
jgi:conjugal transfer/entry exclusion protein